MIAKFSMEQEMERDGKVPFQPDHQLKETTAIREVIDRDDPLPALLYLSQEIEGKFLCYFF